MVVVAQHHPGATRLPSGGRGSTTTYDRYREGPDRVLLLLLGAEEPDEVRPLRHASAAHTAAVVALDLVVVPAVVEVDCARQHTALQAAHQGAALRSR